ncbi:MAG: chromosomal replication initiator protein DnaA, partial [Phycisphaerae bacterium]
SDGDELRLNDDYRFENFVTGPCNRLAHAACVAAAESPGRVYNPLFIHGSVGLGKSHLLQAVCHQIQRDNPSAKVLYLSCETFTNHFIEAIERGALHQFRFRYRHVDALVIDDIQFLAARERTREEFFHTFNTLYQAQKQIILSADEAPNGIPSLEERLVSRFNWGLVARIDPPCLETRMAILLKKAKIRCIDLPEDVTHYVATIAESNTRELEGALTRLVAFSQQFGGVINLEIARQALGDQPAASGRKLSIQDIMQAVTERYNVRLSDLQGKRRNRSVAFPRQVCMYLARELTPLSLEEIGGYFGGRDHTTVLHAIRTIQEQREQDPDLEVQVQHLLGALRKQSA